MTVRDRETIDVTEPTNLTAKHATTNNHLRHGNIDHDHATGPAFLTS